MPEWAIGAGVMLGLVLLFVGFWPPHDGGGA